MLGKSLAKVLNVARVAEVGVTGGRWRLQHEHHFAGL